VFIARARPVGEIEPGGPIVFGMQFVFDGGEGAEEQVGGIGHNGGAARGDSVTGLEFVEFAKGAIDGDGGAEFLGLADDLGGDVGMVEVFLAQGGVPGA